MTSHYRLKVDVSKRYFREYTWVLGFNIGTNYSFDKAGYLFINELKEGFEYGDFAFRRFGSEYVYKVYIKFEGQEEPAFVGSRRRRALAYEISRELSEELNIRIQKNYE